MPSPVMAKDFSSSQWPVLVLLVLIGTICWRWRSDPLAGFPGPMLAAWTRLYSVAVVLSGKEHIYLDEAHRKYGAYPLPRELEPQGKRK